MVLESVPASHVDDGITPALRDGYEVHRAALSRGLNVTVYPRQVMMATRSGSSAELAFVHGIPETSSLAAATYTQDKRMRRELLRRAGLPVPEGAAFAIGRHREQARRFARGIGYPVVVKPVVGDNMSEVFPGLADQQQLDRAIDYLRIPEMERPSFTRAAYALTLLLEPDEEDGRAVAPASYPFLIERHVSGEYVRLLVQNGRLLSAVHCPAGLASAPGQSRDVTGEVHASICALAVDAVHTVPGLAVAAVDIVLADHRRPASDQQLWIVEFSERPWLTAQAGVSEKLSHQIGDAILAGHANERAVSLDEARDEVAISFRIEEATDPEGVVSAVTRAAEERGLEAEVSVADHIDGTAEGSLQGSPDHVAGIFELLLAGQLHGQRAMLVETRPQQREVGQRPNVPRT